MRFAGTDFYTLGHKNMVLTSVEHRRGLTSLMERLIEALPAQAGEAEAPGAEPVKIAFVGRRGGDVLLSVGPRSPLLQVPPRLRDWPQ